MKSGPSVFLVFYLKKNISDGFKAHSAFLKSIRFFRHLYWAIVIIMVEMAIMAKMAIMAILAKIAIWP